jgi:sigma-B regulation protein RsbU (phosphoserine phosphatase)
MQDSIRRAILALTLGDDAQRHFDLAAEHIQRALLEVKVPTIPGVEIGIHAEPARLVGGDYIDLQVRDGKLIFGLGDASGKSLAAALHALTLRYLVRGLVLSVGVDELAAVVNYTNSVIADDLQDDQFITFLLGTLDTKTRLLRIVNAGHEPPLLLRAGESVTRTIETRGMVLGVDGSSSYAHEDTLLECGDIVVIYTDGLTEATNARGELYTIERLEAFLVENRTLGAAELADAIFESVKTHAGPELRDDATVFVMRMLP